MILSVASGKGGTGKTTVAVNPALSFKDSLPVQFLDCDVEESNAKCRASKEIHKLWEKLFSLLNKETK
jgi:MinD superfamily P-loop ATPase